MIQDRGLVKLRLTHKFAELINGIDLSSARAAEEIQLPPHEARLLIAEGWAKLSSGNGHGHGRATVANRGAKRPSYRPSDRSR